MCQTIRALIHVLKVGVMLSNDDQKVLNPHIVRQSGNAMHTTHTNDDNQRITRRRYADTVY